MRLAPRGPVAWPLQSPVAMPKTTKPTLLAPAVLVLLAPAAALAQPTAGATGPATGLAVELRIDTTDFVIDDDLALPGTDAGLFIGYQMPRIAVGVGLDLGRIAQTTSFDGTDETAATTSFLISPGARATLVRSADGRTELLGSVDLGLGRTSRSTNDPDSEDPEPVTRLRLQAGPGVRYWVSPSFAVGATGGLRYDRLSVEVDDGVDTSSASLATTSLFTSFQLTGVF